MMAFPPGNSPKFSLDPPDIIIKLFRHIKAGAIGRNSYGRIERSGGTCSRVRVSYGSRR